MFGQTVSWLLMVLCSGCLAPEKYCWCNIKCSGCLRYELHCCCKSYGYGTPNEDGEEDAVEGVEEEDLHEGASPDISFCLAV